MSSFPLHEENILLLKKLGFDVEDCFENGEVTLDSWGYDDQTYLLDKIISQLVDDNYKVKTKAEAEK